MTADGVKYTAYGVDVYRGQEKVESIEDMSLDKKKVKEFIKQCETKHIECLVCLGEKAFMFVDEEFKRGRTS